MTYFQNSFAFVRSAGLLALLGMVALAASSADAQDMMGMNKAKESGIYVGLNYANVENDSIFSLDSTPAEYEGDNFSFFVGYRFMEKWLVEYQMLDAEYDDIVSDLGNRLYDIEDEIEIFSVIFQTHMGKWHPFLRLAHYDSELSETYGSASGSFEYTESFFDSGTALGAGVDFDIADRLAFRVDYTKTDDHDIITLGPIYHF